MNRPQQAYAAGSSAAMHTFNIGLPAFQQLPANKPVTAGVSASQVAAKPVKTNQPNPMASVVKPQNVQNPAQHVQQSAMGAQVQDKSAELSNVGAGCVKREKLAPGEISPENAHGHYSPRSNDDHPGPAGPVSSAFNNLKALNEKGIGDFLNEAGEAFYGTPGI